MRADDPVTKDVFDGRAPKLNHVTQVKIPGANEVILLPIFLVINKRSD